MPSENSLKNLIHACDRTPEERVALARKAGKASALVRKERKTLREELLVLLGEDDVQKKMSLAIIKEAMDGNTKAFEIIRDSIGEKPKDEVVSNITINNPVDELINSIEMVKNENK